MIYAFLPWSGAMWNTFAYVCNLKLKVQLGLHFRSLALSSGTMAISTWHTKMLQILYSPAFFPEHFYKFLKSWCQSLDLLQESCTQGPSLAMIMSAFTTVISIHYQSLRSHCACEFVAIVTTVYRVCCRNEPSDMNYMNRRIYCYAFSSEGRRLYYNSPDGEGLNYFCPMARNVPQESCWYQRLNDEGYADFESAKAGLRSLDNKYCLENWNIHQSIWSVFSSHVSSHNVLLCAALRDGTSRPSMTHIFCVYFKFCLCLKANLRSDLLSKT